MILKNITAIVTLLFLLPALSGAAEHKMMIQVNSKSDLSYKMALLGAKNLKTQLGRNNVDVEIVTYGPGIKLLRTDNWTTKRVTELQNKYGVKFSVCEGTLKAIAKKHGKEPEIISGVTRVPTGTLRILQLQEAGYHYIKP